MSVEENKALVRRFGQVWSAGNLPLLDELAASDILVSYPMLPRTIRSREGFKQLLSQFHAAFPDAKVAGEDVIAEGDRVVAPWTFRGTHRGELMGIPPTGKAVEWTGISIYRIEGGRVVEERGEEDTLGLLRQLGVILRPARPAATPRAHRSAKRES